MTATVHPLLPRTHQTRIADSARIIADHQHDTALEAQIAGWQPSSPHAQRWIHTLSRINIGSQLVSVNFPEDAP